MRLIPKRNFKIQVSNGSAEFGVGMQLVIGAKTAAIHYTIPTYQTFDILASRIPIPLPYFGNLVRPLPEIVWATVFSMVIIMSFVFYVINRIYRQLDKHLDWDKEKRLTVSVASLVDFPVKVFSTLTEPELLPWFPQWSAGM